ncbi:hypothetical protein [Nocardia heshunensis]
MVSPRQIDDDQALRESTVFAHQPYGAALKSPTLATEDLFDTGYGIATSWIHSRTDQQRLHILDSHALGLPGTSATTNRIQTSAG